MWLCGLLCAWSACKAGSPPLRAAADGGADGGAGQMTGMFAVEGDNDAGDRRCGTEACDVRDPDSCGSGLRCVFALPAQPKGASPESQCLAAGAGADGDPCTSYHDCGPGLDCTAGGGPVGHCRHYCCNFNQARGCPEGQRCRIGIGDGHGGQSDVALCERCDDCDLRDPHACGEGRGCYTLTDDPSCRVCLQAGGGHTGASCELNTDCIPGTACIKSGSESHCVAFCDPAAHATCGEGSCLVPKELGLPTGTGVCL